MTSTPKVSARTTRPADGLAGSCTLCVLLDLVRHEFDAAQAVRRKPLLSLPPARRRRPRCAPGRSLPVRLA